MRKIQTLLARCDITLKKIKLAGKSSCLNERNIGSLGKINQLPDDGLKSLNVFAKN